MNKSEGNYNKEEKSGKGFGSFFSKSKKNDTYDQEYLSTDNKEENTSSTEDIHHHNPNPPHRSNPFVTDSEKLNKQTDKNSFDCPTIPRGKLPMTERESMARSPWENPIERELINEKHTDAVFGTESATNRADKQDHTDKSRNMPSKPMTLKGMMLGLLALVLVPYLVIALLFMIDFGSDEGKNNNEISQRINMPTQNTVEKSPTNTSRQPPKPREQYYEMEVGDILECIYGLVIPIEAPTSKYHKIHFPESMILKVDTAPVIENFICNKMKSGQYVIVNGKYVKESEMIYICKFRAISEGTCTLPVAHIVVGHDTIKVPAMSHKFRDQNISHGSRNKIKVHPKGYFENIQKAKEEVERKKKEAKLQEEIANDKKKYGKYYNEKTQTLTLPETDYAGKPYGHVGIDAVKLISAGVVKTIGDEAFCICQKLQAVVLKCKVVGQNSFRGCGSLRTVVITKNLNWIREGAFADCPRLEVVLLSNTLASVEENLFTNSNNIKEISIPHNIRNQFIKQFEHCKQLNTIYLLSPSYYKMPKTFKESPHDFTKCTLYVPDDKIEEFKADADWKRFAKILPLSQSKWYDAKGWSKRI